MGNEVSVCFELIDEPVGIATSYGFEVVLLPGEHGLPFLVGLLRTKDTGEVLRHIIWITRRVLSNSSGLIPLTQLNRTYLFMA